MSRPNADHGTVSSFGAEWSRFDQSNLDQQQFQQLFDAYFRVFPWEQLDGRATGFDLGCGSGRWARFVATRVGTLHCLDASAAALQVARRNLSPFDNCVFHHASVDRIPLPESSMDFGYSLGVLHHVPDTVGGLRDCVRLLKPGAPFLVYLYYAFDNKPIWFKALWQLSNVIRKLLCHLPQEAKNVLADLLALGVYWPLARLARCAERLGVEVENFPLSFYRHLSFYTMRTDALDRFGTPLEQRFTARQIQEMMAAAGLEHITISPLAPYWCAVGRRTR